MSTLLFQAFRLSLCPFLSPIVFALCLSLSIVLPFILLSLNATYQLHPAVNSDTCLMYASVFRISLSTAPFAAELGQSGK